MKTTKATDPVELLSKWHRRVSKAVDAHYASSRYFSKRHNWIGISLIFFTALVTFFLSTFIYDQATTAGKLMISALSALSFALAFAQTFLRDAERAHKHRVTASRYAALRREIEQLQVVLITGGDSGSRSFSELRKRIDSLSEEAPEIPGRIWRGTQLAFKGSGTADGQILPSSQTAAVEPRVDDAYLQTHVSREQK